MDYLQFSSDRLIKYPKDVHTDRIYVISNTHYMAKGWGTPAVDVWAVG